MFLIRLLAVPQDGHASEEIERNGKKREAEGKLGRRQERRKGLHSLLNQTCSGNSTHQRRQPVKNKLICQLITNNCDLICRGTLINRTCVFVRERKYTQKKVVRKGRGRKPNLKVKASDFCRICKVNLKKNGTYISSENLFTTSKPDGPLSEILSSKLKLFLTCAPNLSSQ